LVSIKVDPKVKFWQKLKVNGQQISSANQNLASQPSENVEGLLEKADSLRLKNDCAHAKPIYEKIIAQAGASNLNAKEGYSLCYIQEGEFDKALELFKSIISEDATRWRVINAFGVVFALNNHFKEAIDYYNLALSIDANNYIILNNIGLTESLNGHLAKGINALEKGAKIVASTDPAKARLELNLALVYAISGRLEEAESMARRHLTPAQLKNNQKFYAALSQNQTLAKEYIAKALSGEN
jgi:Flp pilus assembly protein TadD